MTTLVLFCPKCKESRKFETVGSTSDIKCNNCGGPLFFEEAIASPDASARMRAQGLEEGSTFGEFEILNELGAGGMGKVYKAKHTKLNRTVALKVMKPEFAEQDPDHAARLQREAQAAAQLIHPNVVTLFSVGENEGLAYIEMEYIPGPSAGSMVEDRGPLDLELAVQVLRDSAAGLGAAHKLRIVHRDIKPDNILIHPDGMAKVGDFGLAKSFDEDKENPAESAELKANITMPGIAIGTPHFMSPEQCEAQKLDGRSDLYSLGCTFYFLLTGAQPYRGESTMGVMRMHLFDPPPDITIDDPDMPDEVAQIIFRLMEKDIDKRYQTAQELIEDIDMLELPEGESSGSQLTVEFRKKPSDTKAKAKTKKATQATKQAASHSDNSMATILGGVLFSVIVIIVGALFLSGKFKNGGGGNGATTTIDPATTITEASTTIEAEPQATVADIKDFSSAKFPAVLYDVTLDERNMVLAAAGENSTVYVWKLLKDEKAKLKHSGKVTGVRFSTQGDYLAAVAGKALKVWTKATLEPFREHQSTVELNCCDFSPDGKVFATGSNAGIQLWEIETGTVTRTLVEDEEISCLAFAQEEGQALVAGTRHGQVYYWKDLYNSNEVIEFREKPKPAQTVSISRDFRWIALAYDVTAHLRDIVVNETYHQPVPGPTSRMAIMPNNRYLCFGLSTGLTWYVPPNALIQEREEDRPAGWVKRFHGQKGQKGSDWFHQLRFSPSGEWLLSCSYNGEVALQRTKSIKKPTD
jgi:serine/threonine protein kinase